MAQPEGFSPVDTQGQLLRQRAHGKPLRRPQGRVFHTQRFESIEQLKKSLAEYIAYYNRDRIKLRLNGMSPIEYRLKHAAS